MIKVLFVNLAIEYLVMKRIAALLIIVLALLSSSDTVAQQMQWREVPSRSITETRANDTVEITGNNGVITIRTTRRIQVRVFTILGQSVSVATLNPGTSELKVGSRGIFIVKIGNITQKVAL